MLNVVDLDVCFLLICLSVWIALYLLLFIIFPSRSAEWHCRSLTVFHAVLISSLAGWCCFKQGPWPFTDAGGMNTPLQVKTAIICLSYFIFDFSWCLYHQTEGFTMLLHHFLSIIGLSVTLLVGRYGTELVATICGGEITNPLLQLRWFLRETGHKNTMACHIVDWLFVFSFGFMRLGVGTALLYCYFTQPTDHLGRFGAICIYLMGVIFWFNIVQYALKKYTGKTRLTTKVEVTVNNSENINLNNYNTIPDLNKLSSRSKVKRPNGYLHFDKTCEESNLVRRHLNGLIKHDIE